jgi:hypothetical protein
MSPPPPVKSIFPVTGADGRRDAARVRHHSDAVEGIAIERGSQQPEGLAIHLVDNERGIHLRNGLKRDNRRQDIGGITRSENCLFAHEVSGSEDS